MPILEVDRVSHAYGKQVVVRDLSFTLVRGQIACLLGSSGCGKTTMLRLIAGFEMPSAGSIRLNGVTIASEGTQMPAEQRRIGMVFQDYALFPHLSIADNIGFGLRQESAPARRRRVDEMLELIGLAGRGARFPHELSGGQQQRVALARALIVEPETLLLDEPLSNLDANLREEMRFAVRRLHDAYRYTTVYVTAPSDVGSTFDFVTGVATVSGGTGCTAPANYHCFEFHYSGAGGIGQAFTLYIGNTSGSNTPIAPATGTAHTEGTADTYPVIIKQFAAEANPNSATPVDTTTARIAHIESVRVTATVDPTISLTVAGVASGATRCGVSTDVTTTALSVPFGTMTLNTFKTLAQDVTVSTNASGGYVVTASENDQLGKDGATTPFIPDNPGNNTLASESDSDEWTTATVNGFGFSLQNVDAASVPFQYTTATGNCTGTFCSRQFADIAGAETTQTIFSSTTVANAENVYVCYRLSVGATQAAGDYENQITYTATGTFL